MAPSIEVAIAASSDLVIISHDQTLKASQALLSHIKTVVKQKSQESTTKKNLLAEAGSDDEEAVGETPVWLTLTTKRFLSDKSKLQPGKIPLPHPLHAATDDNLSVCLITTGPQRAYKDIVAHEDFPADLRRCIGRVIDVSKLKAKFSQYEAQRKLYSEHDIFLADVRIINRLPTILGKTFYKATTKRPIPVNFAPKLSKVNGKRVKPLKKKPGQDGDEDSVPVNAASPAKIAKEVQRAMGSALVNASPSHNTAIKVGFANWTADQIADNVDAVISNFVLRWVPQKWRNVKSIHIKGPETIALPIWLTDELWVDDKDVVADTAETKVNAGKKRKTSGAASQEPIDGSPAAKKAKKSDKAAGVAGDGFASAKRMKTKKDDKATGKHQPVSDDTSLDKQIAERKAKLRSSKAKASEAFDQAVDKTES